MAPVASVPSLLLFLVTATSAVTAAGAWRNRPARGAPTLATFLAGTAVLTGAHLADHLAVALLGPELEPAARTAAGKLQWLGIGTVAFLWLAFALEYTEQEHLLTRRRLPALLAWPVALNGLIWLPELAGVVGADPGLTVYRSLEAEGTLYWAHIGLSYILLAAGTALVLSYVYRSGRLFRLQGAAVVAGLAAGWAGSVVTAFGLFGGLHVHAFEVGLVAMGMAMFWAVFQARLTDVVPVARSTVMENLAAGVLVLDRDGRVIDANPMARRLLGGGETGLAGRPVEDVLSDHPELLAAVRDEGADREVRARTDAGTRVLRVDVSPLRRRGERVGDAVVLYDVTEGRRRQEELHLTKRVFSRLLRHNVRNDLTAIVGYADLIAKGNADEERLAESIVSTAGQLVETTEKARDIERMLELDDPANELDVVEPVSEAVESIRDRYPEARIDADLPVEARARAHTDLSVAVENLLENAVEHNDADEPRVDVAVDQTDGWVRIRVDDDGPGIPHEEIVAATERTETPLEHGSGLGLHLANWIVTAGGGDVTFDRTGSGTRVTIRLQGTDAEATTVGTEAESTA